MPYVSDKQRRWAHTDEGTKALGGPKKVKEWDDKSRGKDLPEEAPKKTAAMVREYLENRR